MPAKRKKKVVEEPVDEPVELSRESSGDSLVRALNRLVVEEEDITIKQEEKEDNIRVLMYILQKDGEVFAPNTGGIFVFNPQDEAQVAAMKKKASEIRKKTRELGIPYRVVQMSGITTLPVTVVGGATNTFKSDRFPPVKKWDDKAPVSKH